MYGFLGGIYSVLYGAPGGSRIEARFQLKLGLGLESTLWHFAASEVHALDTNRMQRDTW